MNRLVSRFWRKLFFWSLDHIDDPMTSQGCVGNRVWKRFHSINRKIEVTTVLRNLSIPDAFSQEELVAMYDLIRDQEKVQNWKVPEPK